MKILILSLFMSFSLLAQTSSLPILFGGITYNGQELITYKVNDLVTYQGNTYKCLQAHTSQAGWTPTAVPALWQKI